MGCSSVLQGSFTAWVGFVSKTNWAPDFTCRGEFSVNIERAQTRITHSSTFRPPLWCSSSGCCFVYPQTLLSQHKLSRLHLPRCPCVGFGRVSTAVCFGFLSVMNVGSCSVCAAATSIKGYLNRGCSLTHRRRLGERDEVGRVQTFRCVQGTVYTAIQIQCIGSTLWVWISLRHDGVCACLRTVKKVCWAVVLIMWSELLLTISPTLPSQLWIYSSDGKHPLCRI